MIRVCVAGATGWIGRALVPAILEASDLQLVGAVARTSAGRSLGETLGLPNAALRLRRTVAESLDVATDVLVDFTAPQTVREHVHTAIARGVHCVIGTSGLTDHDYEAIDAVARAAGVGVLAAGNFSVTAALLQRFAIMAARHLDQWEIIEYAHADKVDAPSGTARELAFRLAAERAPAVAVPIAATLGDPASRGATLRGAQVHSVRLPGYSTSIEVIFGRPDLRLTIRHDSGNSAGPYLAGTLLAIRKVTGLLGVVRGLDHVLDL